MLSCCKVMCDRDRADGMRLRRWKWVWVGHHPRPRSCDHISSGCRCCWTCTDSQSWDSVVSCGFITNRLMRPPYIWFHYSHPFLLLSLISSSSSHPLCSWWGFRNYEGQIPKADYITQLLCWPYKGWSIGHSQFCPYNTLTCEQLIAGYNWSVRQRFRRRSDCFSW